MSQLDAPAQSASFPSTPFLTASGHPMDLRPEAFGRLVDSAGRVGERTELRRRLCDDGYLYLSDFLDKSVLGDIRELVVSELRQNGLLDESGDGSSLRARPGVDFYGVLQELASHEQVRRITRLDNLVALFSRLFGETAQGMESLWPRAAGPGRGEAPHRDWGSVSKGTRRQLAVWVPLVDVPLERGPLMLLEKSHRADAFTNVHAGLDGRRLGFLDGLKLKHRQRVAGARGSPRPDKAQQEFGTRWLSADFRVGDVLIFGPQLLHGTLDNRTDTFRLSVDTRFQPVSEPWDPRFAGCGAQVHLGQQKSLFDYYTQSKRWLTGRDSAHPNEVGATHSGLKGLLVRKS